MANYYIYLLSASLAQHNGAYKYYIYELFHELQSKPVHTAHPLIQSYMWLKSVFMYDRTVLLEWMQ